MRRPGGVIAVRASDGRVALASADPSPLAAPIYRTRPLSAPHDGLSARIRAAMGDDEREGACAMRIHGIARHRLGTDGHGVTDLVAVAGCPLRCRLCINKALLADSPSHEVTADELLSDLSQDACYFVATGGGVTFGGGEPLSQWREILAFAEASPEWMRVAIETSLQAPAEAVSSLVPLIDEWIVDVKSLDAKTYRSYAGGDASVALANLGLLLPVSGRVRVRVPVIPGFKGEAEAEAEADELRRMGFGEVEVFGYVVRDADAGETR